MTLPATSLPSWPSPRDGRRLSEAAIAYSADAVTVPVPGLKQKRRTRHPLVSILVPAFNEAGTVRRLHAVLTTVLRSTGCPWEIILIDDGSDDGTDHIWTELISLDARLKLVRLTRNFGKDQALYAGLQHACGDVLVPLDADLQDPPDLIPRFLERWRSGYDVVYGVRRRRADSWFRQLTARCFYRMLGRLSGIPIPAQAGDFRLLDRAAADDLLRLPECDRYSKGLYAWIGRSSCAVPFDRPARRQGRSRQRLGALTDLAFAGLTGFAVAPLRALLWLGLLCSAAAALLLARLIYATVLSSTTLSEVAPLALGGIALLCQGLILLGIGSVGEYLARIHREVKRRPSFLVEYRMGHFPERSPPSVP